MEILDSTKAKILHSMPNAHYSAGERDVRYIGSVRPLPEYFHVVVRYSRILVSLPPHSLES